MNSLIELPSARKMGQDFHELFSAENRNIHQLLTEIQTSNIPEKFKEDFTKFFGEYDTTFK
jgi:hypothetical protein